MSLQDKIAELHRLQAQKEESERRAKEAEERGLEHLKKGQQYLDQAMEKQRSYINKLDEQRRNNGSNTLLR